MGCCKITPLEVLDYMTLFPSRAFNDTNYNDPERGNQTSSSVKNNIDINVTQLPVTVIGIPTVSTAPRKGNFPLRATMVRAGR